MKPITPREKAALFKLFSDYEPGAIELLLESFQTRGAEGIPTLNQIIAEGPALARSNAERILEAVQTRLAADAFEQFCHKPNDLEKGVFLLAATRYPRYAREPYTRQLDGIADALRDKIRPGDPIYTLQVISTRLFDDLGFRGNKEHYYDPDNSFMNKVLDRRLGIPITLSALYLFVGKRLKLPLVGVGLPGHFIVKWQPRGKPGVLLDPFNGGQIITEEDCASFLRHAGQTFAPEMLQAVTPGQILARMCNNLVGIYRQLDEPQLTSRYERFAELLSS
jgi:regulator of sirC expression with transglutaminase-like and TPR domain